MNSRERKALRTVKKFRSASILKNSSRFVIDPNTGNAMIDPISLEPIPLKYMIALNRKAYDARSLAQMMLSKNSRIPLTRRPLTNDEIHRVIKKRSENPIRVDPDLKRAFISSMKQVGENAKGIYEAIPSKNVSIPSLDVKYRVIPDAALNNALKSKAKDGIFFMDPVRVAPGVEMVGNIRVKSVRARTMAFIDPREFSVTTKRLYATVETDKKHGMMLSLSDAILEKFNTSSSRHTQPFYNYMVDLGTFLLTFKKAYFEIMGVNASISSGPLNSGVGTYIKDLLKLLNDHNF